MDAVNAYSPSYAEGQVIEVFVEAYRRLDAYDARYPLRAFVLTIARQRVRAELGRDDWPADGLDAYREHLARRFASDRGAVNALHRLHRAFADCMAKMTDSARQVVQHRYELNEHPQQVGRRLGKPERFVRQSLDRIRLKMAGCLAAQLRQS